MGCALLMLATVLAYRQIWKDPTTGTTGLSGGMFALGVAGNFVLGALMTIGVGLYAPCLVMVSILGMNPGTGFPIMMSSCAFLMPVASVPFVRRKCYAPRAALGLTLAGVGVIGIVTGAVLFVQGNKKTKVWEQRQMSFSPSWGRGQAGFVISGRF